MGTHADAAEFGGRAGSYRNQWDPGTKFFRTKYRDGSFKTPFDPNQWGVDYREATAWQYLWYVPHDPQGLIELFGGRDSFVAALEAFFEKSKQEQDNLTALTRLLYRTYYWAGNEPDIHTAYLFVDAGRPDLAGRWSRWALETSYGDGPGRLAGQRRLRNDERLVPVHRARLLSRAGIRQVLRRRAALSDRGNHAAERHVADQRARRRPGQRHPTSGQPEWDAARRISSSATPTSRRAESSTWR